MISVGIAGAKTVCSFHDIWGQSWVGVYHIYIKNLLSVWGLNPIVEFLLLLWSSKAFEQIPVAAHFGDFFLPLGAGIELSAEV